MQILDYYSERLLRAKTEIERLTGLTINENVYLWNDPKYKHSACVSYPKPSKNINYCTIRFNPLHEEFSARRIFIHELSHVLDFYTGRNQRIYVCPLRAEFVPVVLTMALTNNKPYGRPTEKSGFPYFNILQWTDRNGLDKAVKVVNHLLRNPMRSCE